MNWIETTKLACTALVIAACAYDVVVLNVVGDSASISAWFHSYRNYPTCWLCVGMLCTHFIGVKEQGYVAGRVGVSATPTWLQLWWHTHGVELTLGLSLGMASLAILWLVRHFR